ncbi:cytochrome c family protein [Erythrobacter insulae]|uniref:Cytochrome c family protein n=1 Tax=Erythrobacter insulae TaxID=2584124 RepID=A0A547PCB3_9SPHN|nr:cytochrome c family protein [Erythrobacter insulae]TRD11771.1 cytochrome c family protein [Erythrobacter insulae]
MTQKNSSEATPVAANGGGDMFNTAAGWVLFAAGLGLGLSILSGKFFHADSPEMPEKPGYFIAEPEGPADGPAEISLPEAISLVSAADGEKVFAKCQACHNVAQGGPNGIGPNLHGVMGAAFASKAGFGYSSALSSAGGNWGWEEMDAWLKSPKGYVNGTSMSFAGLGKIEDRAAVALYLNENGGSLTPPEFTPVAEEDAAAEAGAEGEAAAEQDAAAQTEEAPAE